MPKEATAKKIDKISLVYTPVKEEETTETPTEKLTEEPTENGGETETEPPASNGGCGASFGAGTAGAVSAAMLSLIAFKKHKENE